MARRSTCQSNLKQLGLGIIQYQQDNDERLPAYLNTTWNSACSNTGFDGTPQWYQSNLGTGYGPLWWQTIYPYYNNIQLMICPSHNFGKVLSTSLAAYPGATAGFNIRPSYGMNYNLSTVIGCAAGGGNPRYIGRNISSIARPAEKILVTEVRNPTLAENVGQLFVNQYAQWSEPAIARYGSTAEWYGGVQDSCWYNGGAPNCNGAEDTGKSRHFDGCNFLFADGHVKYLTAQPGILYQDVASPGTDPTTRHWWDPTYDG